MFAYYITDNDELIQILLKNISDFIIILSINMFTKLPDNCIEYILNFIEYKPRNLVDIYYKSYFDIIYFRSLYINIYVDNIPRISYLIHLKYTIKIQFYLSQKKIGCISLKIGEKNTISSIPENLKCASLEINGCNTISFIPEKFKYISTYIKRYIR